MAETTGITWTDATFNPWIGCTKVSPECKNCYAELLDKNRFSKTLGGATTANPISHWGPGAPRNRTSAANWKHPIRWNREARESGVRRKVFCASLADWLDDEVAKEWRYDLLDLIRLTPNLDWQLLTKRPQNFRRLLKDSMNQGSDRADYFIEDWLDGKPPANVWIGVSQGADQAAALAIPAVIHFLSCEPMLGRLDILHVYKFDWVIFGGESGKNARPFDLKWLADGIAHCRAMGVAAFAKQLGANPISEFGNKMKLKDSHGGDMTEWPEHLRVRQFPSKRA